MKLLLIIVGSFIILSYVMDLLNRDRAANVSKIVRKMQVNGQEEQWRLIFRKMNVVSALFVVFYFSTLYQQVGNQNEVMNGILCLIFAATELVCLTDRNKLITKSKDFGQLQTELTQYEKGRKIRIINLAQLVSIAVLYFQLFI